MLVQIEQATGSSVNNMGTALTALMSDLSSKISDLTEQSRTKMLQSSQASADAANSVLKEARDWTNTNREQLASLIEKHTAQLNTADQLRTALSESAVRFTTAGSQFNSIIANLQRIANETSASTTALSGAAKSIRDSQQAMQQVANLSGTQAERLSQAGADTQRILGQISQAMQQYETTFGKVEAAASQLLGTLEKNLAQHLELCRKGYESLVKVSDEHFTTATQRLGSTVNELEEYLQDLSEVIGNRAAAKGANGGG
jgi:chromosome segregation ATPase